MVVSGAVASALAIGWLLGLASLVFGGFGRDSGQRNVWALQVGGGRRGVEASRRRGDRDLCGDYSRSEYSHETRWMEI